MSAVYQINKGVNRPITFKGLKAQYIVYLAAGLIFLFIAFAVLYIAKISLMIILPLVLGCGAGFFTAVARLSRRYGEHGLMKYMAQRKLPHHLSCRSAKVFTRLKVH